MASVTKVPKPASSKAEPSVSKSLQKSKDNNKGRVDGGLTAPKNNNSQQKGQNGKTENKDKNAKGLSQSVNLSKNSQRGGKPEENLSKSMPNAVSKIKAQAAAAQKKLNQQKQSDVNSNLSKSVDSGLKNSPKGSKTGNNVPSGVDKIKALAQQKQQVRLNKPQPDGQLAKSAVRAVLPQNETKQALQPGKSSVPQKGGNSMDASKQQKTGALAAATQSNSKQTSQNPSQQNTGKADQKSANQNNKNQPQSVVNNKTQQLTKSQQNIPGGQQKGQSPIKSQAQQNMMGGQQKGQNTTKPPKNMPSGPQQGQSPSKTQQNIQGGQQKGLIVSKTQQNAPGGQQKVQNPTKTQQNIQGGQQKGQTVNKAQQNVQGGQVNDSKPGKQQPNIKSIGKQNDPKKPGSNSQNIQKPGVNKTQTNVAQNDPKKPGNNSQNIQKPGVNNMQPNVAQKNQNGRQSTAAQNNQQGNMLKPGAKQPTVQTTGNKKPQNTTESRAGQRTGGNNNTQKSGQTAKNEQNPNAGRGPGDKEKKRKKQMQRRKVPVLPKIIESPAGVTSLTLPELQLILDEIETMKEDKRYDGISGFLSQLLQKVQNFDAGNFTRTEIELFVRQFQDFNEGFHYRMDQKPRGHALLLTNYEFYKVPGDPWSYEFADRPGAEIDADKFETLLTDMGYIVTRRDNIKHWEMEWELKCMAELDHKKFDSFLCIISSHGTVNQVYGCDGLRMLLNKQIRMFKGDNCPSLAGKPKLFFLQSCQAEEREEQVPRTESTVPDAKPKPGELEKSRFLINDVDFLVGYSTLPGQLSYRHEQTGSWYLSALHDNLKQNGDKYDIVTLLEDVNFDISCKTDQYNYLDSSQVSMFSSTLRGPLFFH